MKVYKKEKRTVLIVLLVLVAMLMTVNVFAGGRDVEGNDPRLWTIDDPYQEPYLAIGDKNVKMSSHVVVKQWPLCTKKRRNRGENLPIMCYNNDSYMYQCDSPIAFHDNRVFIVYSEIIEVSRGANYTCAHLGSSIHIDEFVQQIENQYEMIADRFMLLISQYKEHRLKFPNTIKGMYDSISGIGRLVTGVDIDFEDFVFMGNLQAIAEILELDLPFDSAVKDIVGQIPIEELVEIDISSPQSERNRHFSTLDIYTALSRMLSKTDWFRDFNRYYKASFRYHKESDEYRKLRAEVKELLGGCPGYEFLIPMSGWGIRMSEISQVASLLKAYDLSEDDIVDTCKERR